jgi:uncharacterized protein (DUF305 family)
MNSYLFIGALTRQIPSFEPVFGSYAGVMRKRKSVIFGLGAMLLAATMSLTACASSQNMPMGQEFSESAEFSNADIMFAQMMIPHHQQALDMSELALQLAQSPELLDLATQIRDEQDPEIAQMRSWLASAGASEDMGHASHGMDGMLTEEQMAQLLSATGADFERLFLEGMIGHHEGAIAMAQMVLDSNNPEVQALAEAIVSSQQTQIDYMKTLLLR